MLTVIMNILLNPIHAVRNGFQLLNRYARNTYACVSLSYAMEFAAAAATRSGANTVLLSHPFVCSSLVPSLKAVDHINRLDYSDTCQTTKELLHCDTKTLRWELSIEFESSFLCGLGCVGVGGCQLLFMIFLTPFVLFVATEARVA